MSMVVLIVKKVVAEAGPRSDQDLTNNICYISLRVPVEGAGTSYVRGDWARYLESSK